MEVFLRTRALRCFMLITPLLLPWYLLCSLSLFRNHLWHDSAHTLYLSDQLISYFVSLEFIFPLYTCIKVIQARNVYTMLCWFSDNSHQSLNCFALSVSCSVIQTQNAQYVAFFLNKNACGGLIIRFKTYTGHILKRKLFSATKLHSLLYTQTKRVWYKFFVQKQMIKMPYIEKWSVLRWWWFAMVDLGMCVQQYPVSKHLHYEEAYHTPHTTTILAQYTVYKTLRITHNNINFLIHSSSFFMNSIKGLYWFYISFFLMLSKTQLLILSFSLKYNIFLSFYVYKRHLKMEDYCTNVYVIQCAIIFRLRKRSILSCLQSQVKRRI